MPNPLAPLLEFLYSLAVRAPWRFLLGLIVAFGISLLLITFDTSSVQASLAASSPTLERLSFIYPLLFTIARVGAVAITLVGLMAIIIATVNRLTEK